MLDAQADITHLEKLIAELITYPTADKAQEDYRNGKLKDGVPFLITESATNWICAIWIKGKLPFVNYDLGLYSPNELPAMKRKAVARLLEIAQTGWVPTAQMGYLPQRFQHVDSGKTLFTAGTIQKSNLDEARSETEVIDEAYDATAEIAQEQERGNEEVAQVKLNEEPKIEEAETLAPTE